MYLETKMDVRDVLGIDLNAGLWLRFLLYRHRHRHRHRHRCRIYNLVYVVSLRALVYLL
jgi:hypothetical protein